MFKRSTGLACIKAGITLAEVLFFATLLLLFLSGATKKCSIFTPNEVWGENTCIYVLVLASVIASMLLTIHINYCSPTPLLPQCLLRLKKIIREEEIEMDMLDAEEGLVSVVTGSRGVRWQFGSDRR